MDDPFFQTMFADRIGGAQFGKGSDIYKFEKIKRAKRQAIAEFPERKLIDFGIGENDNMAPLQVRQVMQEQIHLPENRGYADNGVLAFKEAVARFMQRHFAVSLDAATEINHCIGSKPALAMLPATLINPGDITLMTVPGYPVAGTHTQYYGGSVYRLPLLAEHGFFPDLNQIPHEIRRRAKLLVLNYPNSPTGTLATTEFYERVIKFARQHEIIVVQDAAHILLSYPSPPLSFLSVPGAHEVGLEVHSLSKGFDMIGWRIGWVCGHPLLVRAFADVKDNSDSGQFIAIQKAAAAALDDDSIPRRTRQKYERRLRKLVTMLRSCGWECQMPGGTYFLYVPAPQGVDRGPEFATAEHASQYLISEHSMITVPWDDAGAYLRFSVTYEAADEAGEDALMRDAADRLRRVPFYWQPTSMVRSSEPLPQT